MAQPEYTLLVADDEPVNLRVLGELLQSRYRVRVANSGGRALQVANSDPPPARCTAPACR